MPVFNLSRTALTAVVMLSPATAWADLADALKAIERRDFPAAVRELSPLANAGDAEAQYQLGTLYANGDGVPQNYVAAKGLFNSAASKGNGRARHALEFLNDIGAFSSAAVQTAAVGAAPVATGDASAPIPGGLRLQLGTVLNEAGGNAEARRVSRRYQTQLAGIAVAAEQFQMASGDIVYRVLTPALAETQAREICDQIRAENGPCLLIKP